VTKGEASGSTASQPVLLLEPARRWTCQRQ